MDENDLRGLLSTVITKSESRARKRYAADALDVLEKYGLLAGFFESVARDLGYWQRFHVFYFPTGARQLYCVYTEMGHERLKFVEMREHFSPYNQGIRRLGRETAKVRIKFVVCEPTAEASSDGELSILVPWLVKSVTEIAEGSLQRAPALVLNLQVPDAILKASPKCEDLQGVLLLVGEKERSPLSQATYHEIGTRIAGQFDNYLETIQRYTSYETDFFIPSHVSQEARIQESIWQGLGYAIYMLLHRFRNLRQAAEFIGEYFPTSEDVLGHPEVYEERVRDMQTQMKEVQHLESILRYLPERPESIPLSVEEVTEILEYLFEKMSTAKEVEAQLVIEVEGPGLLTQQVVPPFGLIEEVLSIHLDNALREIGRSITSDRRLIVEIYDGNEDVCLSLTNFGPPIPPDVQADLRQIVQVPRSSYGTLKRPQRTGLGVFLSALILQQVGGAVEFRSPVKGGIGATFILRFRKYAA